MEEGRTQAEAYATLEPTLIKMLHMLPNVDMQLGGDWKNNFRKFLTSINVSTDDQAKIVDMDTYLKYALGPAAAAESQTSGRPSTFMFTSFLKAFAASSEGDPRAAENVVGNMIAGGHNAYEHHLSQLQQASDFPAIGKNLAETYRLPNFPSMDQTRQQLDEAQVIHNIKQNSNGLWVNAKAGDNGPLPLKLAPPPGGNMGPPAPPTLPKGWSYEGPQ